MSKETKQETKKAAAPVDKQKQREQYKRGPKKTGKALRMQERALGVVGHINQAHIKYKGRQAEVTFKDVNLKPIPGIKVTLDSATARRQINKAELAKNQDGTIRKGEDGLDLVDLPFTEEIETVSLPHAVAGMAI